MSKKDIYTVQINQYRCVDGVIFNWNTTSINKKYHSIFTRQYGADIIENFSDSSFYAIPERNDYHGIPTVKMNVMVRKNGKLVSYKELKDIYPKTYDKILNLRNTHWS